jgi:hypothetical protein
MNGWGSVIEVDLNSPPRIVMPLLLPALECDRVWLRVVTRGDGWSLDPHWS